MADTAITEMPTRKPRTSGRRAALKDKTASGNEANIILAAKISDPALIPIQAVPESNLAKENHDTLSQPKISKSKSKAAKKQPKQQQEQQEQETQQESSFEKDLREMQEKLQGMRLEKAKTEELLKEKDEILRMKEEELESKGREQDKLHMELKKLQKLKEFKPTMAFPMQSQNDKKKKGCPEKKRPAPPYVLWCKDHWNVIKQENPEAEFKEISNILGAKWKNVSAEEKKPYEQKYQAEKEAYLQVTAKEKRESEAMHLLEEEHRQKTAMELLEQYMQFKQEAEKDNKKTKKEKDPLKPKHPMSAFFLFTNERRAALVAENKTVPEIAKITGEEWKNMTEKQKRPYEETAKKNKEKYMQEMEFYKQNKEEEAANLQKEEEELMKLQKHEALQLLKKKEKTENIIKKTKEEQKKKKEEKKNVDPNKPKKPASSYILFSKEARKALLEERPGTNNSTITAMISVKWKELSEEERKVWNDKAAEAMEAYKKELEDYKKSAAEAMEERKVCNDKAAEAMEAYKELEDYNRSVAATLSVY